MPKQTRRQVKASKAQRLNEKLRTSKPIFGKQYQRLCDCDCAEKVRNAFLGMGDARCPLLQTFDEYRRLFQNVWAKTAPIQL